MPNKINADLGYVVADIYALNDTEKGDFYLTTGALSRGGADQIIRERCILNDIIEAAIEFPGGYYAPATAISSVLLLVNKAKDVSRKN
ncbi:N-6 DNA methylase [Bacillus altitudinis]|uniref:N-6 DNA methylase n=1 Tax=Bacillus altitudinis TaxID=293387 RepID=UPI00397D4785